MILSIYFWRLHVKIINNYREKLRTTKNNPFLKYYFHLFFTLGNFINISVVVLDFITIFFFSTFLEKNIFVRFYIFCRKKSHILKVRMLSQIIWKISSSAWRQIQLILWQKHTLTSIMLKFYKTCFLVNKHIINDCIIFSCSKNVLLECVSVIKLCISMTSLLLTTLNCF